jgi:arylsulfatase A-like enzyme
MGWDHHGGLPSAIQGQVRDTDQPTWALVQDLEERGLLEDTIVVWGGEFGRTVYSQGSLSVNEYGRDHHPRCFSMFMLGAGIKGGTTYGATDDYGYYALEDKMHIHDLHATLLHLLGMDHERLTYRFAGRDFRLTDVHGQVARDILA